MTKSPSEPRYVKIVNGPTQPSGSGVGYVVVAILSFVLLAANTYGFSRAFRLPPLFGLVLAILTLMVKLHMLRPRPAHERASSSGLDRAMFYLVPAFLSTLFSAFGIYCLALVESEMMETQPSQSEQQAPIKLYEQARAALKPKTSDQADGDDAPDGVEPIDGDITESAIQRELDEAEKAHRQLQRPIRSQALAPSAEEVSDERVLIDKREGFLQDTLNLTSEAIGCWLAPAILELFTVIILLGARPRD